jgi:muconate cycloisomerase
MDEGVVSHVELEEFIRLGMLDGLAMKPARCGGLTSNKRQIELCMEHGLKWVGSGLCDPDLSLGAALALYDAYGLDIAAALNGPQFLDASVLKNPVVVKNAVAEVPEGPGLGLEVDMEKLVELSNRTAKNWNLL